MWSIFEEEAEALWVIFITGINPIGGDCWVSDQLPKETDDDFLHNHRKLWILLGIGPHAGLTTSVAGRRF